MDLDYRAIGKRIKIVRIKAELIQEKVAEMAGISPQHLSNIENGSTHVSLSVIVSLANVLGVTTDEFLCENVIHATATIERDIADALKDCDPYELRIVRDMVVALKGSLRRDTYLRQQE